MMNDSEPTKPNRQPELKPVLTRLHEAPIIHPGLCDRMGSNINGPSLIRVPKWVENPLGRYYLYFAHHEGRYIRMAYSNSLTGPWKVYRAGVLDVAESLFVSEDIEPSMADSEWAAQTGGGLLYAHIASPDVHIDHKNQHIKMYFHGLLPSGDQQTRLAISSEGLEFNPQPPLLGLCYFRVFEYKHTIYAISWGGRLARSRRWDGPFELGPPIFETQPVVPKGMTFRHCAVKCDGDYLDLFYTCIGDFPERIRHVCVELDDDWNNWRVSESAIVLSPQLHWEGAELPAKRSVIGAADGPEHGLRDPCIYEEAGRTYVLYSAAGESAIGIAEMQ